MGYICEKEKQIIRCTCGKVEIAKDNISTINLKDSLLEIKIYNIKRKTDDAGHDNKNIAFDRADQCRSKRADAFADRDQHGLFLIRLPPVQHIKIGKA